MNVLILSKNFKNYKCGHYHQDIIDAFSDLTNVYLYGPGYDNYEIDDDILDVISKSPFEENNIDLIVSSTSWDKEESSKSVDPHPNINLSEIRNIYKVYFLNKEYKKLGIRFEYIKKQNFDLVCTVHPNAKNWEEEIGVEFLYLPFGISLERFRDFGLEKKYDFSFTGNLHKTHTDSRFLAKKQIFQEGSINSLSNQGWASLFKDEMIKTKFKKYRIFWAEWGARNFFLRSALSNGRKYAQHMNRTKVSLNTPSAIGIFNPRFFELMATKSLILCPKGGNYSGLLKDGENCIMYREDMQDFDEKLIRYIEDDSLRSAIVEKAYKDVSNHSYKKRIEFLLNYISKK